MNAFSRRGACPALSAPMQTGDGLLVRLNPVARGISPTALIGLCRTALRHGNGVMEVTARGSLQMRGLTVESVPLLAVEVDALGIAVRTGVPVQTGPLAGLDPDEIADPSPLANRIRTSIRSAGLEGRLGPKVSVVVDGCGRSALEAVAADVRLTAESNEGGVSWRLSIAGDADTGTPVGTSGEDAACNASMVILSSIAALGLAARARDLTAEQVGRVKKILQIQNRSVLPVISPSRGESSQLPGFRQSSTSQEWGLRIPQPISPLEGEMSGRTEGGVTKREPSKALNSFGISPLTDSRLALGIALPFGHTNAENLIAFAEKAETLGVSDIRLAPKRTILALCPSRNLANSLQLDAQELGFVTSSSDPRRKIAACPGAPACASGHIAARDLAAEIANDYTDILDGSFTLHVSGCAKGCAHPGAAALTLVGSENGAGIVVAGTARDEPLAYTADGGLARGFGRVARLVRDEKKASENSALCLSRLGSARIAEAFGKE